MNAARLHRREFPAAFLWRWHLAAARALAADRARAERTATRQMATLTRRQP